MKQKSVLMILASVLNTTVLSLAHSHHHHHRRPVEFKRDSAAVVMNDDAGGGLEPMIVANATACGCSTFLTTLYGAMSSADPTSVSTVYTTSYSTETVLVTINATEIVSGTAPRIQPTGISQQSTVTSSSYTTSTRTMYHTEICGNTSSNLASLFVASEFPSAQSSVAPAMSSSTFSAASASSNQPGDSASGSSSSQTVEASSSSSSSSTIALSIPAFSSSSSAQAILSPPLSSETNTPSVVESASSVATSISSDQQGYASYPSLASAVRALDATGSSKPSASASPENALPKPWAVAYDVYTPTVQGCKLASDMAADVQAIASKGFGTVRLYTTDCSVLDAISPAVRAANMKLIPSIYLTSNLDHTHSQIEDLKTWAQWDLVEMIAVGNEALSGQLLPSIDVLTQTITSTRSALRAAGYTGAVTTAETINIWQSHAPQLCAAVDIAGANIHPFFDPHTAAPDAGAFVLGQLMILHGLCPGKTIVNLETGWPSGGDGCVGEACPDPGDQKRAILSLRELDPRVQAILTWFSWEDEEWKPPGVEGVEHHWGLKDLF